MTTKTPLNLEISRLDLVLQIAGEQHCFHLLQQDLPGCARFIHGLDRLVANDGQALSWEQLEAVAEQAEDILREILIPSHGGPRLTAALARELRTDQRLAILQSQIDLNRLDEMIDKVVLTVIDIHASRVQMALRELIEEGLDASNSR